MRHGLGPEQSAPDPLAMTMRHALAVNTDRAGVAAVGSGEPEWWQGVKPPC